MSSNQRIMAVDAMRGIAIAAMILVNNPGSWSYVYGPMRHAEWHGWTLTDLIFPFFLFIVGIAITYSLPRQMAGGHTRLEVLKQAAIRGGKLVGLGLFLALFYYDFGSASYSWWQNQLLEIRLPGVLQRIGIVFVICAGLFLVLSKRSLWGALFASMLIYLALVMWVPYPDGNGGASAGQWAFGNSFVAWIDHLVLGAKHVYYPNAAPHPFDPEGIVSTLPAVATCISGMLAAFYLQTAHSVWRKSITLVLVGLASALLGEGLANWIPINKSLWTPTFVLVTSGYALLLLGALVALMDGAGWQRWAKPFIVCGANSIAFYMLAGVLARVLIMIPAGESSLHGVLYQSLVPVFGSLNASLVFAILFLIVCYLPIAWMYRKRIFWKV